MTDRELRTASAFASQASLALDKARHYADARRGQREAEVFTQLIHDISASLNLDVVLQRVAEAARELCTADVARIALRRPGSDTMPFRYWAGTLSEQYRSIAIEAGKGVGGQVLLTGRPFRTDDYVNDPRITKDYLHAVRADGISAVLGAPVRIESRIEGLLFVDRRSSRPFTDGDEAVLVRLADHAATAIANAELYAGQEERAARLRALCRLTQLVSSSLDTERVLGEITRSVAALSNAPAASLWIVDEGARMLEVRAFSDPVVGSDLRVRRQPVGDGLTGWVAVHRQSLHVPDVFADPRTVNVDWWRAHGFTSFYGMPIADGDRLVGVLTLKGRRPFELTSDDDDLLRAFVAQAAVAIRNAWLFEESDRRRREAESSAKALAESEARYRGLVEGSIQGIWIHKDFIIQFANQMSARILGYEDAAALVGRDLREFVAPHERVRLEGYYAARLRGDPAPRRYDFEAERVDGSRIWIENIATVVSWQNEPAILAALLDVTEMKRLEEQLRQAQKMEAVGQLAGGVAHDFNNLLTIIKGRSELLLQRRPLDARACRDAELIRGAADRAGALTRQLLAFSRRQLLRPRLLDLSALAVGLGPMLERLVDEHIALAVRPDVDSGPVFADPAHLEQVVMNLVVNARDAMPDGGRLTIDTAACELDAGAAQQRGAPGPGSYVVLSVRDTGCGMDEATRARIFEPFFTTKEKGKGTGLGLSTVYGIVQQSGGFIEVDTAVGRGSTFRVHLPRATESTDATGGGDVESAGPCSGDETVLLVEDEAAVRDLACEILEASGYSVLKAKDAEEALMLSAQHAGPVHLLVTDVVMPGMNGFELAHRLEAARPAIKCVFMSGYTDTALAQHGTLPPATNFLEKPFAPERLARFVRDVLDAPSAAPPATA